MNKNKIFILAAVYLCVILFVVELSLIELSLTDENGEGMSSLTQVKECFQSDIQELKDGKYSNFSAADFSASIEEVKGIYNLQILNSQSYKKRSFMENVSLMLKDDSISLDGQYNFDIFWEKSYRDRNMMEDFEIMNGVIDKFFQEDIDKSFLTVEFRIAGDWIEVYYNDFEKIGLDETYDTAEYVSLFGNTTSEGGYMIQMNESLNGTWLSKGALGDIMPSMNVYKEIYPYLSCKRQIEDVMLHLADGDVRLSELEERVLQYLNTDAFPLPQTEGITYGIGEARILANGDYEGVCFMVRRVYEGIPFEYGDTISYDSRDHDTGEISYAESKSPDTIRGFDGLNGTVVEMQEIKYMLSVQDALELLSNYIAETAIYEVQGVELIYRNCDIPGELSSKISDILKPKWKIILSPEGTKNYITYYVDVVTGEIT